MMETGVRHKVSVLKFSTGGKDMKRGNAQTEETGNVGAGRSLMVVGVLALLMAVDTAFWLHSPSNLSVSSVQVSGSSLLRRHASTLAVTTVAIPASLDVRLNVWDIRDGIRNIFGEESFY
jgi:hypothetical protein